MCSCFAGLRTDALFCCTAAAADRCVCVCAAGGCRMLLGLQPARYVVPAHYEDKLRKLLEVTSDMDGGLPLEYDITPLTVRSRQQVHSTF